MLSADV